MKNKAVLVTGAAGFIGFHLARKLLDEGVTVISFDNCNEYYDVKLKYARLELLKRFPNLHSLWAIHISH